MLLLHWIGNRFLSMTTNVLYNTTLSDMETCYKLIERSLIEEMGLRSNRFDIEPEITAKLLKRKAPKRPQAPRKKTKVRQARGSKDQHRFLVRFVFLLLFFQLLGSLPSTFFHAISGLCLARE